MAGPVTDSGGRLGDALRLRALPLREMPQFGDSGKEVLNFSTIFNAVDVAHEVHRR